MINNNTTAYPNPTDNELIISGHIENEEVFIEIFDPLGRQIEKRRLTTRQLTSFAEEFDVRDWIHGFYFIKVFYSEGNTETIRVYKSK
jgi:hypothetical protein